MIWLTQWLCPQRHCVIAIAWDDRQTNKGDVIVEGARQIVAHGLAVRCGICGSVLIEPEHGRTCFTDLETARPLLLAAQAGQLATRAALDAAGLTVDGARS